VTRQLIVGAAGGAKIRGNLEIHRWHRRRMRNSRKLEDPSLARLEDEDTRKLGASSQGWTGRCMVQVTCELSIFSNDDFEG